MRTLAHRFLVLALAAAAAAPVQAQDRAATAPAKASGPSHSEFRIGGFMVNGERSYDFSDTVRTATGSIKGVEVLMRSRAIGLYVRSLSGTFGKKGSAKNALQPQVISLDARVLVFPPSFTLFAGFGKRGLSSALATKVYNVVMGGISSTVDIGGSGLRTHVSAAFLIGADAKGIPSSGPGSSKPKNASPGMEGEAAIFYRLPRVPLFVTLGYRTEIFTGKAGTVESPEEVRGLRLGGGLQFGGH